MSDEKRCPWSWFAVGLIVVTTLVTYRGVTANGFVLDDHHTIEHNPALRSWSSAVDWLTSPYATSGTRKPVRYRPVLMAGYAADYAVWGGGPAGIHATNLAIHLVVILLAFLLARRLWNDETAAVCAAGLVALHPLNAEAVNYLTARSSSLSTVFVLTAVWASEHARRSVRPWWSAAAYGFGLAAMGTKEVAVVLPALIIIWDRARDAGAPWTATLRRSWPWWGLVGGFLVVRTWVLWGHTELAVSGPGATIGQGVLFAIKIYLASLGHWFWPTGLAVDHAWPVLIGVREGMWLLAGAAGAIAATIAVLWVHRRMGWCLVWFWAAIAPVGALAFISRLTLYQDNRAYLAGISLAWLVGGVLAAAGRRWLAWVGGGWRPAVRAVIGIAVLAGVASAVHADAARTAAWTNKVTLWDDVLAKYPESIMAHNAKGLQSLEAGQLDAAREWFERALRLAPGFSEAHKNIGVVFARLGDWDRAAAAFEFALKIDPQYSEAGVDLGKVYEHVGRPDLALEVYDRLLRDDPGDTALLGRTALLLEQRGNLDEAAIRYRRLLKMNPGDGAARMSLGTILLRGGRWAEARAVFEAVLAHEPNSYAARFNLGAALDGLGAWDEALDAYRQAAALDLADPDPYFKMGVIRSKQERWAEADLMYRRAVARDRGHFSAHMNWGRVAERMGDARAAISHYRDFLATVPADPAYDALKRQAQEAVALLGRTPARGAREVPPPIAAGPRG